MDLLSKENFHAALGKSMDTSSLLMIAAAVITVHLKSSQPSESGIGAGLSLLIEIAPRVVTVFTLAGPVQAVVPRETLVRWIGQRSGHRDMLIGISLGSITPGGPMTHFRFRFSVRNCWGFASPSVSSCHLLPAGYAKSFETDWTSN
jgi:hypothetical protein